MSDPPATVRQISPRRLRLLVTALAATAIVVWLLARLYLLRVRSYDPDEFEHLHAAFCVAKGLVPYRDFFEHHGPLPQYLAAPLVGFFGPTPFLLLANRVLSYVFVLLTMAGTYGLSRRLWGRSAGLPAVLWLITFHWFTDKSLEWRPDVPGMCLITWSAYYAVRVHRSGYRGAFFVGSLVGLAALCTQKVAFLGLGILLGMVVTARAHRRPVGVVLLTAVLGVLIPGIVFLLFSLTNDSLVELLRCTIYYPLKWKSHAFYYGHLIGPAGGAPFHVGSAIFGLIMMVSRIGALRPRRRGEVVPIAACLCHFSGLLWLPAVYLQFYLLALPLCAVLAIAAFRSGRMAARTEPLGNATSRVGSAALMLCSVLLASDAALWLTSSRIVAFASFDRASLGLLAVGGLVWFGNKRIGVVLTSLALCVPSLGRVVEQHVRFRNESQEMALHLVNQVVTDDQTVLDGFSGLACLRPHAFYWWWINEHSIPIMASERALPLLQQLVADGQPALIIYDSELRRLDSLLAPAIARRYRPTARQPDPKSFLLLLRNDLPDASD